MSQAWTQDTAKGLKGTASKDSVAARRTPGLRREAGRGVESKSGRGGGMQEGAEGAPDGTLSFINVSSEQPKPHLSAWMHLTSALLL